MTLVMMKAAHFHRGVSTAPPKLKSLSTGALNGNIRKDSLWLGSCEGIQYLWHSSNSHLPLFQYNWLVSSLHHH